MQASSNARAYLKLREECGGLDAYLWRFVGGKPLQPKLRGMGDVQAKTEISDALVKRYGQAWLQVRWFDHLLCLYAGHWHDQ